MLAFLGTIAAKREGRTNLTGLGSDVYCLGVSELFDAFRQGLEHPELSRSVQESIVNAVAHPLGFLRLNRLAHVLMSREMEHKATEFLPSKSPDRIADLCAEIESALIRDLEPARARRPVSGDWRDWLIASPVPEARRLAESLGKTVSVLELDKSVFQPLMSATYRHGADEVGSHYRFPAGLSGPAEILLTGNAPYESACNIFHEWIHIGQARSRKSPDWVQQHVSLAEREAYALEVLFRIRFGDRALYDMISSLSPHGFQAGLAILVEQLFFRLRKLPV
jgi:hypothetical protein